jgi:hypothetical protein
MGKLRFTQDEFRNSRIRGQLGARHIHMGLQDPSRVRRELSVEDIERK